ncbi:unnamed protein product [[Candida] boidinii]|uniref:Unnamed protein product n=1 Tax=Candida boidinii TaxID=5477 RepID=A0A9W6T0Q8_CANBO|nr:unnamed protein product [[Candida] boidinii]
MDTNTGRRPKRKATANVSYKQKTEYEYQYVDDLGSSSSSSSPSLGLSTNTTASSSRSNGSSSKSISNSKKSSAASSSSSASKKSSNATKSEMEYYSHPVDDIIPWNWIPPLDYKKIDNNFNRLIDLKNARIENNCLILKNGLKIKKGDDIYMVCEPAGEPYYVARITD